MPFLYEGERHRQLRATLARAVAPVAAAEEVFARHVRRHLSAARRDGGFDLMEDFATDLLFGILCELMAIPEEEQDEIRPIGHLSWILETSLSVRERESVTKVIFGCMAALTRHVHRTLRQPGNTLVHYIHRALPETEEDSAGATAFLAAVMLVMGNDALAGSIAFAVRQLLSNGAKGVVPQKDWARLSDDALRFSAPVGFANRVFSKDTVFAGCPFLRGERVIISPLAANHDPAEFGPDTKQIRPNSEKATGLTFGGGAHVCVGARMSRNVVKCAFAGLAELPPLSIDGPDRQRRGTVIRTLSSLPLKLG